MRSLEALVRIQFKFQPPSVNACQQQQRLRLVGSGFPALSRPPTRNPGRNSPTICVRQQRFINYDEKARDLNQKGLDQELSDYDTRIAQEQEKQDKTPWHREGAADPPVKRQRSAGAMTKGKLLTTPSRLLKLVLPLSTVDLNSDRKDVAPLALLVHPSQPLSYLSRLIQSELPSFTTDKGEHRVPNVSFHAMESKDDDVETGKSKADAEPKAPNTQEDSTIGEGSVQSYSGAGREAENEAEGNFIKWSASTEIGDFIRDAARAKEFEVEIEGRKGGIKVAVPSFNDRTFYLRQRLRRTAEKISSMAAVKSECDRAAHKAGQRMAMGGVGVLIGYWFLVYLLTFKTGYGWDMMEPITYLCGTATIIGGSIWFVYHNREISYRSAMNMTISRRQSRLYEEKGFDIHKWEGLIDEGNAIRREIKAVAAEYDVEWDEKADEKDPKVVKALREDRQSNKKDGKKKKEGDDDDEDDDEN